MSIETFCPYGGTGSGKTTQASELALEVHRRTGKKTRLASWSREGWKEIKPAIDLGIIAPCYFPTRKLAIQAAQQVCKGRWPEHIEDPESPMLTPKNQPDRADIGALVIDSGTEMAQFLFSYSLGREANEEGFRVSAQEPSHIYRDGDTPFAAGGKPHYGAIQARIVENVRWTKELPLYVMWTWLETKGKDTSKGKEGPAVYVPDVIGDAINSYVPSWFDNTVHLVLHGYGDVLVHRMYLKTHTGDDNVPCPAKCRPPLGGELPSYLEGKQASIAKLMQLLDAAEEQGMRVMRERLGWEEERVFQSRALGEANGKIDDRGKSGPVLSGSGPEDSADRI